MAQSLDLALKEVDLLGHLGVAHAQQLLDDVVHVYLDLTVHHVQIL